MEAKTSQLFRFQKFITVALITDWLNFREFIDFDTALCNKRERSILHTYIKSFPHPFGRLFRDSIVIPLSVEIYQWAENKNFDLSYLSRAIIDGQFLEKTTWLTFFSTPKVKAYAPHLKTIQVTEKGLDHFKQALPYADNLEDITLLDIISPPLTDLVKCGRLTRLNFNGCSSILEADVVSLVHHCPSLTTLYLRGCKNMKKTLAKALIVRGRGVVRLDLRQCYQIDKIWIRMLVFLLRSLVEFSRDYISDFTARQLVWYRGRELQRLACVNSVRLANGDADFLQDNTLDNLGRACSQLTDLNLSGCSFLTDQGLSSLLLCGSVAQTLLVINLQGLTLLNEQAVKHLTESCPQLREVYLMSQNNVREEGLRSIGTNCKNLRRLHLVDMMHMDGEILQHIGAECRRLETLNLSKCRDMTDRQTEAAFPLLSNLSSLNLSYCSKLSDVTLVSVGRSCPYLRDVNLDGCTAVTLRGIAAVLGNSRQIKHMSFQGIKQSNSWSVNYGGWKVDC